MRFERPRRSGFRRTGTLLFAAAAFVVVLTSCGAGSGYEYVSSSDHKAYFKVPYNWKFFDKRDILVASGQSLSALSNSRLTWLIGFDSDPDPSVDNILKVMTVYPVVQAQVQQLSFETRDTASLSFLRNAVFPLDRYAQGGQAEILTYDDVLQEGGFHGIDMTFDLINLGAGAVAEGNVVIRYRQIAILDQPANKLYLFTIHCESHCYRDNKALIDQIAGSWTVKER